MPAAISNQIEQEIERRTIMTAEEKIALNEQNLRQALEDYGKHTDTEVLEDVSDTFIRIVARDNYYAKQELRELFRKSPGWDETLDAIVINGSRTHEPDWVRAHDIGHTILRDAFDFYPYRRLKYALCFFTDNEADDVYRAKYLDALNTLAPGAYVKGRKRSRIFRDLCKAVGVFDDTKGSWFQQLYAQFADEILSKQIPYKLFVSINPAHWITMSNPKRDERGETLKSCHSFNSTEYDFNSGCAGYARDKYSFIVFTVANPKDPELLNNRKTTRQVFVYKPGSGVLLQSRMYNTSGGTYGAQKESAEYRDLIQRELSALENATNLWNTQKYHDQRIIHFWKHDDFGGYPDWTYSDFAPMVSVRTDAADPAFKTTIGEAGVCIVCGEYTSSGDGLYCRKCINEGPHCDVCGDHVHEDDLTLTEDARGNDIHVCPSCLGESYNSCADCGGYFHEDRLTDTCDGEQVCPRCLERYYTQCDYCKEYFCSEDTRRVETANGEVDVCVCCADAYCVECDDCECLVYEDHATVVYGTDGYDRVVCPDCLHNYTRCKTCGTYVKETFDGVCQDCMKEGETS